MIFKNLLSRKTKLPISTSDFNKDKFSNYPPEEFESLDYCIGRSDYSYYCYTLCRWGTINHFHYTLRISDIRMIDGVTMLFVCPAYKISEDMAKRKALLNEPNKLNLTPGKLSISIDDIPKSKLDNTNSYYDKKLMRRVPFSEAKNNQEKGSKSKPSKVPDIQFEIDDKPKTKQKVKQEARPSGSVVENDASSVHLPPFICMRLWVLSRDTESKYSWYSSIQDGTKSKVEFTCLLTDEPKDERYVEFSKAYLRSEYKDLDLPSLSQSEYIKYIQEDENANKAFNCIIDAMLCSIKVELFYLDLI